MTAFVVANPRSGSGRTASGWKQTARILEEAYPRHEFAFTQKRGDATTLVRNALRDGHHEIVAVGGDGTINEAVNGFFDGRGAVVSPEAVFAFVTSGTGGDFRKTFGIEPGVEAAIARLRRSSVHRVDVGRVSCVSSRGAPVVRHFINIASFGMSGVIVDSVNRARIAKLFGGSFAFAFHSAIGALRYRDRVIRIIAGDFDRTVPISTVAVANGRYFGGGMMVAPHARADDGLFDVVVMGGASKSQTLNDMKLIYTGDHLKNPNVQVVRAAKVMAVPVEETRGRAVLIETDGESTGRLPATFEILPGVLNIRC
jgi:YegS/Rv2252/BmrU family lipid kinase